MRPAWAGPGRRRSSGAARQLPAPGQGPGEQLGLVEPAGLAAAGAGGRPRERPPGRGEGSGADQAVGHPAHEVPPLPVLETGEDGAGDVVVAEQGGPRRRGPAGGGQRRRPAQAGRARGHTAAPGRAARGAASGARSTARRYGAPCDSRGVGRAMMVAVEPQRVTNQKRAIFVVGSLVGVVALVLGILIATRGRRRRRAATTTRRRRRRRAPSTDVDHAAPSTTSTTIDPDDLDLAAFPDLRGGDRYDDPVRPGPGVRHRGARLRHRPRRRRRSSQGDTRSGEVVVSPQPRHHGRPRSPCASSPTVRGWSSARPRRRSGSTRRSPGRASARRSPLIGAASAFEGNVLVQLYADGSNAPIGSHQRRSGAATACSATSPARSPSPCPRAPPTACSCSPKASAEDGTTVAATAIRVRF